MSIETMISDALTNHGAVAVAHAAGAALRGDYSQLHALGIDAHTLGDAWRAQGAGHKAMTDVERLIDGVQAQDAADRIGR